MLAKTLLVALGFTLASTVGLAADSPLSPTYNTPQQKKYFMEFCKIDLDSDGMVSAEEWLNKGNPLSPGFEKNPKLAEKLKAWKAMAGEGKEVDAAKFVAYMDNANPLSPAFKK